MVGISEKNFDVIRKKSTPLSRPGKLTKPKAPAQGMFDLNDQRLQILSQTKSSKQKFHPLDQGDIADVSRKIIHPLIGGELKPLVSGTASGYKNSLSNIVSSQAKLEELRVKKGNTLVSSNRESAEFKGSD